ncbi:uncharacterized protein LOC129749183 [Uranotaenia lowii]|uniref:uncharacterized protein LOC129749183 n=1 Tax=Uranotaenia lowii TaxID=190385 RepID=UPI002478461C|nr:uncharacterized protein LOC129749183 [Uranotaenia lowii]
MPKPGRFVRINWSDTDESSYDSEVETFNSFGCSNSPIRESTNPEPSTHSIQKPIQENYGKSTPLTECSQIGGTSTAPPSTSSGNRMEQIETFGRMLNAFLATYHREDQTLPVAQSEPQPVMPTKVSPTGNNELEPLPSSSAFDPSQGIRWGHVQKFPEDVPTGRLWEVWRRFIQNFKIVASLSNARSPSQLAKLLFLSLSEQLQRIINAFNLMPDFEAPDSYNVLVKNIETHLVSMTDPAAEHESFQAMKQSLDESMVSFHSRLVEKVRLCGYSQDDQDKFVRSQLIAGMLNRDLAISARNLGYTTTQIVQIGTRAEASNVGAGPSTSISRVEQRSYEPTRRDELKRSYKERFRNSSSKRFRNNNDQRLRRQFQRCPNCNYNKSPNHRCPALTRKCIRCKKFGHFVEVCPSSRVDAVEDDTIVPAKQETEQV